MGILQDPVKALGQADWYLKNQQLEKFPGAFELAAGNLCRQTLEQVLFILCFYSGMPQSHYLRGDRSLRTAGRLLDALDLVAPRSRSDYWSRARRRGPRIAKFARLRRTLRMWQRILNEPSHFSLKFRRVDTQFLQSFISRAGSTFDDLDRYLLIAGINEVFSGGRFRANLSPDSQNTPGISAKAVIRPKHLHFSAGGQLSITSPQMPIFIISDTGIPRGRWPRAIVLPRGTERMQYINQLVTKEGHPVNLSSLESMLNSMGQRKGQRASLVRRFRQLGDELRFQRGQGG